MLLALTRATLNAHITQNTLMKSSFASPCFVGYGRQSLAPAGTLLFFYKMCVAGCETINAEQRSITCSESWGSGLLLRVATRSQLNLIQVPLRAWRRLLLRQRRLLRRRQLLRDRVHWQL
jgi:hypothetical protein